MSDALDPETVSDIGSGSTAAPEPQEPAPLQMRERAQDAIERFAEQAEKAQTETREDRRVNAVSRYAAACKALGRANSLSWT